MYRLPKNNYLNRFQNNNYLNSTLQANSCSERLVHGTMVAQLRDLPKATKHHCTMVLGVQWEPQMGSTMSKGTSHSDSRVNILSV